MRYWIMLTTWNGVRVDIDAREINCVCQNKEALTDPDDTKTASYVYTKGADNAHHIRETREEVYEMIKQALSEDT